MPVLIDSHCHLDRLDLSAFENSLSRVLEHAAAHDVKKVLCVAIDRQNIEAVIEIAEKYPNVYASVGQHPTENETNLSVEELCALAAHPKVIAIGETGLDYYHDETEPAFQEQRFIDHIKAAQSLQKPLIIHTRKAQEDTLKILCAHKVNSGVFHCFTESLAMAQAGVDLGLYISFSGIITFKNAGDLREVVKQLPLERILVETDAPYLTPVPYRGKANYPAYSRYVAECVAEIKGISYATVAEATTQNFINLFKLEGDIV